MANQNQQSSNVVEMKDFDTLTLKDLKKKDLQDMEFELIASTLLKDNIMIPVIKTILTPDDFCFVQHKILWRVILELYHDKQPATMLTITERLRKTGELDKVGYSLVLSLGEAAFTTAYTEINAKIVKDRAARRQLFRELQGYTARSMQLSESLLDDTKKLEDVITQSKTIFKNINAFQGKRGINQRDFFKNDFKRLCRINHEYSNRCTGFDNLDAAQIFSAGLYVLGGQPATGKTTFCWQLLNQLGAFGEHCLYCTYEMSRLELCSKTLARTLYQRDKSATLTAANIRNEATSPLLEKIFKELCEDTQTNIEIFELTDESIDDLFRLLDPYCNGKDKSPVVCLDYLQIVPPSTDKVFPSDKARIDDTMRKLKNFQRETNTTFIVISSLNRQSYTQKASVDMSSFKESGSIEYSADVIWALTVDESAGEDAKAMQPRPIVLKCLKNRQGTFYEVKFDYYSAHDCFAEHKEVIIDHTHDDEPPIDDDDY